MNRDEENKKRPPIPKILESDGIDVEYSSELADRDDIEAQARADAADRRAHERED